MREIHLDNGIIKPEETKAELERTCLESRLDFLRNAQPVLDRLDYWRGSLTHKKAPLDNRTKYYMEHRYAGQPLLRRITSWNIYSGVKRLSQQAT